MNKTLYRLLVKAVPKPKLRFGDWTGFSVSEGLAGRLIRVLERERVRGGVLALMNARRPDQRGRLRLLVLSHPETL